MPDTRDRLVQCFKNVFPDLEEAEIPRATMERVEAWDSLASVTLIAIAEEDFGVEFLPDDLAHFVSFDEILALIERKLGSRG